MKTFTRRKAVRRPTVVTVAKRAGVSIASVSRVLNGLPASTQMERRVRAASAALDYVPDARGRSLKAGRTLQLAFAVADIANPVYVEMMRAIDERTKAAGFRLVLHSTGSDPDNEIDLIEGLGRRYVDGLILSPLRITPEHLRALRAAVVPTVIIGSLPDDEGVDSVRADSRRGVGLAIAHLVAAGRRSIGFVNGDPSTVPGTARREGYRSALAVADLPYDEGLEVVGGEFTYAAGHAAARQLFSRARPDALFCADDLIAVGAMRALADLHLRVPDDVAVVGMDDTELARMSTPALSSVSLGSAERARLAAGLLLDRLKDPTIAPRHLTVDPHLVVRESSGGPRRVSA
ncbi:MAG TPA: LacI family DNA-binding transcriptional regulator [Candidatus Limnocylindria bacterium]|jgi:LacI family transcriptional regulator|nr:LacI family DNA-binding transcriptional regulator [Candidatus Limnocylindria bacterium]